MHRRRQLRRPLRLRQLLQGRVQVYAVSRNMRKMGPVPIFPIFPSLRFARLLTFRSLLR